MQKYLIGFIILCLMFSCRQNEDILKVETEIPPAEEITLSSLNGLVVDNNDLGLIGAKVDILQDDQVVFTGWTNSQGRFTISAPISSSQNLFMQTSKDGYLTNLMRLDQTNLAQNEVQAVLASNDRMGGSARSISTAGSLVILKGKLVDNNAEPQALKLIVLTTEDGRTNYAYSNRNGDFRILAPKDAEFNLQVQDKVCGNLEYDRTIGPFSEDFNLGNLTINSEAVEVFTLSGNLTDCDDQPLPNGIIQITVGRAVLNTTSDANGNFSIEIESCLPATEEFISILAVDEAYENISAAIRLTNTGQNQRTGTIKVCTGGTALIEMEIGGDSIRFVNKHTFLDDGRSPLTLIYPISRQIGLTLYFPGKEVGSFPGNTLYVSTNEATFIGGSRAANGTRNTIEVTTFTAELIEGTFSGDVINTRTNNLEPITGTFSIRK
ncbi:MAG: hypothetical protein AAF705_15620 [Bacteroidota bacterium]